MTKCKCKVLSPATSQHSLLHVVKNKVVYNNIMVFRKVWNRTLGTSLTYSICMNNISCPVVDASVALM